MKEYKWLNKDSRLFLSRGYLKEGQTAEERIREICEVAENILDIEGFADKFEDYMARGWISLSSPVWSNFGNEKGLPISCNGSLFEDNMVSILSKNAEIGMQTKYGAGTSGFLGLLRNRGSKISAGGTADGPVHFLEITETNINVISQGSVRRGSFGGYLNIDHPDIKEWLEIREEGNPIQKISIGVCIPDYWLKEMLDGDKEKQKIWLRIIRKRFETGYPYIFFTDTVNENKPQVYKDLKKFIYASNLCTEIMLPASSDESFVCNLSSVNLLHYDEWKDTDLVETITFFLDAVMTEYIEKTDNIPFMETVNKFAKNHRAIGIGVLGWHSYLQSKMIPFVSKETRRLNVEMRKLIDEQSLAASKKLAEIYGEPPLLKGYGVRNTTRLATAPTTSSSFILGVSASDELENSNYYTKNLAKGKFTIKNKYLKKVLKEYGKDTKEVWEDILIHGGSVQHLEFLSDNEREVFKTFGETPQIEIIEQAADRQPYIDQGQSLNLMIHPNTPVKDVSNLMLRAWELGIKTLYYQRSSNVAQELNRKLVECESCSL